MGGYKYPYTPPSLRPCYRLYSYMRILHRTVIIDHDIVSDLARPVCRANCMLLSNEAQQTSRDMTWRHLATAGCHLTQWWGWRWTSSCCLFYWRRLQVCGLADRYVQCELKWQNQTVNDGVAHSKNPKKCAYHVTFDLDLDLEHTNSVSRLWACGSSYCFVAIIWQF